MKTNFLIVAAIFALAQAFPLQAEEVFSDSFESGDMSATSINGFAWGENNRTSVVTADAAVYNNGEIYNVPPVAPDWEPKTGDHSLRFRYPAGSFMAEQRFEMGNAYPEIWMSFWLKVPINFSHPSSSPDNQKLFRLWMDEYGSGRDGAKVGMSFRGDGQGGSYFFAKINSGGDEGSAPFISVPRDRGRWMHLVVHVASESSPGENDGVMEVWKKWEGTADYIKTHNLTDQPLNLGSSVKGFSKGYLMGWANAAYQEDTEFLVDDFKLGTSPLFSESNAPNPPSSFEVQ